MNIMYTLSFAGCGEDRCCMGAALEFQFSEISVLTYVQPLD